ncbi:uncharacterized protein LOC106084834 [Stomoxys calcitrans]|uniref:uncharacterized protein LOC106084834 n=1 Tax=Stomoxys calcitrans TaxID=35570 RepID=UPI0027E3A365|nr:uncharacterized protein LOC106084834 [Stomoxys calcitrans]
MYGNGSQFDLKHSEIINLNNLNTKVKMAAIIYLAIITTLILPLQSQIYPSYPYYYYNTRPPFSVQPTFSQLTTTTPTPFIYRPFYNGNTNGIRIWPYVIGYSGYYGNRYLYTFDEQTNPTAPTLDTVGPNSWFYNNNWNTGKK